MRPDYVRISASQLTAGGGQEDWDYRLDRPPFTRYFWNGSDFEAVGTSTSSGGVFRGPYTWAARPTSDLTVGDTMRATDVGMTPGTMFIWTGSRWRRLYPFTLVEMAGSVASPVATLGTGITAGTFTLPSVPTVPAGLLEAGNAVMFDYMVTQSAAFTTDINLFFGTAGTTGDSQVGSRTLTAAANRTAHSRTEVSFSSSTNFVPAANIPTNDQTTAVLNDRTTNVDLTAAMLATLAVANGNATNSWKLVWFRLSVL